MKKVIISSIIGAIVGMAVMFFIMGFKAVDYGESCYRYGYKHGAKDYYCKVHNETLLSPEQRSSFIVLTADGSERFHVPTVLELK